MKLSGKSSGFFLLCLIMPSLVFAADYYRWEVENGVVHFSDSPPKNAKQSEKYAIPIIPSTSNAPPAPPSPSQPPTPLELNIPAKASEISIISPKNEATIHNNLGNIAVMMATNLPLSETQSLRLVIDGKKQQKQRKSLVLLENIDRGTHKLQAQLIENNKVVATSKLVTIFLHRAIKRKPTPMPI